ncbi:MAG: UDP-N-acetylmuramoyl-L-alanine--D-glutamate ligase [Pseudomonadota bacterium]
MIAVRAYEGRRVAVFGLGRTGRAAVRALLAGGAKVSAWDDNEATRAAAEADGIELDDLNRRDWGDVAALVLSPGVPLTHPKPHRMVELARAVDAPVIGDVELFAREIADMDDVRVIGVTGTNGKSTTTALIGHVLRTAGLDVRVGGNIGEAVLGLDPPRPGAVYVLELSSYQLDLTETLRCDAAVFLNLSPDHLDRHGSLDGYFAAKRRIFAERGEGDAAIIGVDDTISKRLMTQLRARDPDNVIAISSGRTLSDGVYGIGGVLYDALEGKAKKVLKLAEAAALPGDHNAQNAAAAYAVARRFGVEADTIVEALKSFPGLAHRQQLVARVGALRFVNDSKATNAESAARSLASYDDVFWIAGGLIKDGDYAPVREQMSRVRKAYLIGKDAKRLAGSLGGHVEVRFCEDIEKAAAFATHDALQSGLKAPVVLLAPACASQDQFRDFEERGEAFATAVRAVIGPQRNGDAA